MTDTDRLDARLPYDDEIIVSREWHQRALAATRERDELRGAAEAIARYPWGLALAGRPLIGALRAALAASPAPEPTPGLREAARTHVKAALAIIELADNRAMAADGEVGHARDNMDDREWRMLYQSLQKAELALAASPAPEPTGLDVERLARAFRDENFIVEPYNGDTDDPDYVLHSRKVFEALAARLREREA